MRDRPLERPPARATLGGMSYRLSRDETVAEAAARIAREELDAGLDALRGPGDLHARIRAARRATRRTHALVRLVRAGLGPHAELAALDLGDAARRLAVRRDATAAEVFTRLIPDPTDGLADVGAALAAARDADTAGEDPVELTGAAADLARVRARVAHWPAFDGWRALAPGLRDSYRRGRRTLRTALADPMTPAFTAWRPCVVELKDHTLLLQRIWEPIQAAFACALADLAALLRDDHDLERFRVTLAGRPDLPPDACKELLARVADRRCELRRAALALGRRIYAEPPRAFVLRIRRYWQAWREDAPALVAPLLAPEPAPPCLPPDPEIICPGEQGFSGMS